MDAPDSTPAEKHCVRCQQIKPITDFGVDRNRKHGIKPYCKPCHNAGNRETRQKHIDKYRAIEAAWRANNKEKTKARTTAWRLANADHARELGYEWRRKNPEKQKEIQRKQNKKKNASPAGRLRKRISYAMRRCFADGKIERGLFRHLGYTHEELRVHIERQFVDGMTWENADKWHIDHIVPLSAFSFKSVNDEEFKAAWALSNLRPIWASDNLRKYNKMHFLI